MKVTIMAPNKAKWRISDLVVNKMKISKLAPNRVSVSTDLYRVVACQTSSKFNHRITQFDLLASNPKILNDVIPYVYM